MAAGLTVADRHEEWFNAFMAGAISTAIVFLVVVVLAMLVWPD